MIPRGRFVPAAGGGGGGGGGTIGPLVSFEGGTDSISAFPAMARSTGFTLVTRIIPSEALTFLDFLFGFNYGTCIVDNSGTLPERGLAANFNTSTFTGVSVNNASPSFGSGDVMAIMCALDTTNGLTGGRGVDIWINGVRYMSSTDPLSGDWRINDSDEPLRFWTGSQAFDMQTNGLWVANSALDPATHFSSFFDGSDQFQPIDSVGQIGGITPNFWQNGDANAWNSNSDNNGNSYTLTGAVS